MELRFFKALLLLCVFLIILLLLFYIYQIQLNDRNLLQSETTSSSSLTMPLRLVVTSNFSNNSFCAKTQVRELDREAAWQSVDTAKMIYIISAYFISAHGKVYIIGARPMYNVAVICQFWLQKGVKEYLLMKETDAKIGTPNDPAGPLPFTATIFECPVDSQVVPNHLSLVTQRCDNPRNLVRIHNASEPQAYERQFTVCVAPVFNYGAVHDLVEWIELNRILGVDKFIFYNYSISMKVDLVLNYYLSQGLVEIIRWRLPFLVTNHIHYFGQTAALNDCLLRTKQFSEFITNVDIDEYIIPHSENVHNWTQMLTKLQKDQDGYIFRNTFFRKEWVRTDKDFKQKQNSDQFKLVTLKHIEREGKIYPPHDRGKYFARTARSHYTLIHEIPGARVQRVPPEIGLLHHYRNWEKYDDKQARVKDSTVPDKYGDILVTNVRNIWKELEKLGLSVNSLEVKS